jgi:hypothetical protein
MSSGLTLKPHRTEMLPHRLTNYNTCRPVTIGSTSEPSFYRSPPPSPPKSGRAFSNSQRATSLPTRPSLDPKAAPPSVGRNKTVSPQDPANYTATDHVATSLPTPRPSLESPDNSQRLPSSDPTNPAVIAPFTPRPSLESAEETHILSFDQVVSRLKPLLDGTSGTAGERKISLEGISPDIVDKLREKSRASELPGWENLR